MLSLNRDDASLSKRIIAKRSNPQDTWPCFD